MATDPPPPPSNSPNKSKATKTKKTVHFPPVVTTRHIDISDVPPKHENESKPSQLASMHLTFSLPPLPEEPLDSAEDVILYFRNKLGTCYATIEELRLENRAVRSQLHGLGATVVSPAASSAGSPASPTSTASVPDVTGLDEAAQLELPRDVANQFHERLQGKDKEILELKELGANAMSERDALGRQLKECQFALKEEREKLSELENVGKAHATKSKLMDAIMAERKKLLEENKSLKRSLEEAKDGEKGDEGKVGGGEDNGEKKIPYDDLMKDNKFFQTMVFSLGKERDELKAEIQHLRNVADGLKEELEKAKKENGDNYVVVEQKKDDVTKKD